MAASTFSEAPAAGRWLGAAWPLPAVATWLLAWLAARHLPAVGLDGLMAWALASLGVLAVAWVQRSRARRLVLPLGWLAMALLLLPAAVPPWLWLLAGLALLAVYPLQAWRDAPLFPTPAGALQALQAHVAVPGGARVLDAGCGLGHGLRELHAAFPDAQVHGTEWSWPLALWARLRCRFARVRRGDLWAEDWSGFELVYLFQRPESMRRAHDKAMAEMRPGAWLVSLEFAVPGVRPHATLATHARVAGGRRLCLYRVPPVKPDKPV